MNKPLQVADRATLPRKRPKAALTVTRPELLPDGTDLQFRQFVHDALAFASRLLAVRDGYARLIGITGVQYTILIAIYHLQFEQDVGIKTVADHLHLSGAFVTTETNKLVAKGMVRKFRDPDDGRRIILRTTEEARERLSGLARAQSGINDVHFDALSRDDFIRLQTIMPALVDSTERALRLLGALDRLEDGPDLANILPLASGGRKTVEGGDTA